MPVGYGQQTPYDRTSPLAEITFIIRQMLARMDIMKVVRVQAVHSGVGLTVGTVDVLPLVSQIDGNGNAQPHGTVFGLQYFRLQGGANAVICDPAVGDVGFVIVPDRDGTSVKNSQSTTVTPGSFRRNDLADGIYIGGILNAVPKQYIQFTATGITITDMNGNKIVMQPGLTTITSIAVNVIGVLQVNGVPVVVP